MKMMLPKIRITRRDFTQVSLRILPLLAQPRGSFSTKRIYERYRLQFGQKMSEEEIEPIKGEIGTPAATKAMVSTLVFFPPSFPLSVISKTFQGCHSLKSQRSIRLSSSLVPPLSLVLLPSGQKNERARY